MARFLTKFHNDEDFTICYDSLRIDVFRQGQKELDNLYDSYNLYADILFNDHPVLTASILRNADPNQSMYIEAFEQFDIWKHADNYSFPYLPFLLRAISSLDNIYDDLLETSNPVIKVVKDKKNLQGETTESKLIDLLEYITPGNSATSFFIKEKLIENFPYLDKKKRNYVLTSIHKNLNPQPEQSHYPGSHQSQRDRQHQEDVEWMRDMLRKGQKK